MRCQKFRKVVQCYLRTRLISQLREEFPDRIIFTNTVMPGPFPNSNVFETYNSILSLHRLVENVDSAIVYDNAALRNICSNVLKLKSFTMDDQNSLVSRCISGQTACQRFPSPLNLDFRKIATNLVMFPRLHFFIPTINLNKKGLNEICHDMLQLNAEKNLASVDYKHGRFIALLSIFRGKDLSIKDINEEMFNIFNKKSNHFVKYVPNNNLTGICEKCETDFQVSGTFIGNSTSIRHIMKSLTERFNLMLRRKAFLHFYTGEGMEESEFTEAESNVEDLAEENYQYEVATDYDESETNSEGEEVEVEKEVEVGEEK